MACHQLETPLFQIPNDARGTLTLDFLARQNSTPRRTGPNALSQIGLMTAAPVSNKRAVSLLNVLVGESQ
jgi:hypothetical protein